MDKSLEKEFIDQLFNDLHNDKLVLPTLPEIALKVRDTLEDEDASLADVAKIITKDTALSARIIQVANSPLLRTSTPIETVSSAVMRMGSTMIRNLVTSMVMEQMFQATSTVTDTRLRDIWTNSTEVAAIALTLTQDFSRLKQDQAMLAGLIYKIGVLPILSRAENHPELLLNEQALDRIIASAHSSVGAAILNKWHFPEELVMVAMEHDNLNYDSKRGPDYVDIVIVASLQVKRERLLANKAPIDDTDWSTIPAFKKLNISTEIEFIDFESCADLSAELFG